MIMSATKTKYHNKKVVIDGISFDSKREGERYLVLKQAEREGLISELRRQVAFELIPKVTQPVIKHFKRIPDRVEQKHIQDPITYVCDFQYRKDGVLVVEDCKISPKMIPADYRLKEKLFRWKFGFSIKRVYKPNEVI